jgi:hypothetical protein
VKEGRINERQLFIEGQERELSFRVQIAYRVQRECFGKTIFFKIVVKDQ